MDIPGYASIGTGSFVANFMMSYRDLSSSVGAREALFYTLEAKYYGELAGGVGEQSDLYIARPGKDLVVINDDEIIEKKLIPICRRLSPARIDKKGRIVLNNMEELKEFPIAVEKESAKRSKKVISVAK